MTLMQRHTGGTVSLRDAVERLVEDSFWRPLWLRELEQEIVPPLDLVTTADAVIARVALPGVRPEDVDVAISDDHVMISGTFEQSVQPGHGGYEHRELSHGSFSRRITLPHPVRVAAATATFRDGLLTITLPRAEEARARRIRVASLATAGEPIAEAQDLGSPGGPVLPR